MRSLWVIRLSALGDVVLCEPAIAALAARHPDMAVTVVTRAAYADLFRRHPAVAAVVTPEEARRLPRPDLVVDLQNRVSTRLLALRARERRHWRKRDAAALWRAVRGRPMHVGYREGPHQLDRIAAALGLASARPPRLHLDDAWVARAAADAPRVAWVALLPGASREVKAWPSPRFAEVAAALRARGIASLAVGGPGDEERLAAIGAPVLPSDRSLGEVAAVLARAEVAVGNDSGLLHLAAAVGVPTVAVFGPTPPGRWAPAHGRGAVVTLDPPCGPCSDHGARPCRRPRRFCLEDLPADAVVAAVLSRLRDTQKTLRG